MTAGAELLAAGCRYGAWTSNRTMLTPSSLTGVHAACAQVRQTMMLVTQRELQGVPWLLRCVAAEICALMCELGAGSVVVISAVGAIV